MYLPPCSPSDGLLDVIAMSNSVHLASSMVGLTRPISLGTAKEIKIVFKAEVAVQIDGEPFVNPPSTVTIGFHKPCVMLKRAEVVEDESEDEVDGYETGDTEDSVAEIRGIAGLTGLRGRW